MAAHVLFESQSYSRLDNGVPDDLPGPECAER